MTVIAPRKCLSEPPAVVYEAARFLDAAVSAHLIGKSALAEELIRTADMPEIYYWLKPIWSNSERHLVRSPVTDKRVGRELRSRSRMPTTTEKRQIHERDGYNCRFCGIPVIRFDVRKRIIAAYPRAARWGSKEAEQHTAMQAMWAQYDHVIPHALGGGSDLSNVILTCAACNFGRGGYSLDDVGIADPRLQAPDRTNWDGLERFR